MAKKATARSGGTKAGKSTGKARSTSPARAVARTSSNSGGGGRSSSSNQDSMGDAFIKMLQSPLVADLLAVAATAALAALAEHGFSNRGGDNGARTPRAGKAVKEAGKAAAAAIGRRLSNEIQEIREAAKGAGAKA